MTLKWINFPLNRVNLQFNDSRQVYVLCFKYLTQDYKRFLVKNKKKTTFVVSIALTELGFNVRAVSEYICRWCQKLDHLQQNLEDLQIPRGRGGEFRSRWRRHRGRGNADLMSRTVNQHVRLKPFYIS